jgi:uncharacterized membrane protein YphA (DoxX/SURF4 family)
MKKYLVILIRIVLGAIFFTAGMSQVFFEHRFPGIINIISLQDELSKFHLDFYLRFIAFSQIIIGILLITQRFATLGAVMLFPMLLNILMVTVAVNRSVSPYVIAGLSVCNIYLLIADYHKLKFIFIDNEKKVLRVPFVVRRLPFHDVVFVIGMLMVLCSPFLSHLNLVIAYVIAVLGLSICIGIQLYEKRIVKEILEKKNLPYL